MSYTLRLLVLSMCIWLTAHSIAWSCIMARVSGTCSIEYAAHIESSQIIKTFATLGHRPLNVVNFRDRTRVWVGECFGCSYSLLVCTLVGDASRCSFLRPQRRWDGVIDECSDDQRKKKTKTNHKATRKTKR